MPPSSSVHVLTMGGTIDKDYPRLTAGYAFEFGDQPAASRILNAHPNLGISFEVASICCKDSLEINDSERVILFDTICRILKLHESSQHAIRIVVTHGTDTMLETAQYIQTRLHDTEGGSIRTMVAGHIYPPPEHNCAIAFTGATKPERFIDSDASFNVGMAVGATSFCSPGSVLICMNGNVIPVEKCMREPSSGLFKWRNE